MSEIKVDALSTVSGSGNLTVDTDTLVVDTTNNNVFVKKTSAAYQTVGHELKADGRAFHTASGGKALSLTRTSSNGAIMDFYNSGGTEVGSIETAASGIGIKLGGNAASNLLDDYETGTWTPTLVSTGATFQYSVRQGIYTKVGDLVTFNCVIQLDGAGNSFSGNSVALNGWPFANRNSQGAHGRFFISGRYLNLDHGSYTYAYADLAGNSSSAPLKESGDNVPTANLTSNDLSSVSGQLYLHGHYYTDA
jgi:hypothetical protein